jgi:apolipoprotein N-acyltransferase
MDTERIETLKVLLVQTAQPPVDFLPEADRRNLFDYALRHWQRILTDLMEHHSNKPELIVLPESSVPYGTYHPAYTYEAVLATFETLLGEEGRRALPPLEEPLAALYEEDGSDIWLVSNAFWAQALANSFDAEVVIGLAHHEHVDQRRVSYNSALRFVPQKVEHERYDKRVLLPMGEYIPFAWARGIAARYGVYGSFTAGQEIKVFQHAKVPYGISICYEETFSELMRANRLAGAELLVNVTSDVWYPNTRLPEQHLEHARVRTVEAGLPLIRACNTGVTACVDALGRDIAVFGDESGPYEWRRGVLAAELPLYSYPTLFTQIGDKGLVYFAALSLLFACLGELWAVRGRAD